MGSDLAAVAGIALAACLIGSVAGFRAGARDLSRAGMTDTPDSAVSMFSKPLQTAEIDRYFETYRSRRDNIALQSGNGLTVVPGGRSTEHDGERVAVPGGSEPSHRLSA
ncbi:hypothetical protein A5784_15575 [Mycobacterium sp. 852013-50091_SCH5140682]|nr:hypothetical protein A5784_15575 [Mycobacterium sp. 852013-50091_SCH5140682]